MAGLSDLAVEDLKRTIKTPNGKSFTVRGIALSDIARIVRSNTHDVMGFFDRFMNERQVIATSPDPKFATVGLATKYAKDLLSLAPELVADIIAHASDEPHLSHVVIDLPFPVQLEAMEAIAELTFVGEDGIKKAGETLVKMFSTANTLIGDQNRSEIGMMQSEDKPAS